MTVAPGLEPIATVRFAGKKKPEGRVERLPWDILVGRLLRHEIRAEKDGVAFSPTIYHEGPIYRDAHNVRSLTLVVLDIDDGTPLEKLRDGIKEFDWVAYTTHSHTTEHPKYRLVFRLTAPVPVDRWRQVWRGAAELLAPGHVDQSCKGAERLYFYPACPRERKPQAWAVRNVGEAIDPERLAAAAPPEPERTVSRNGTVPLTGSGDYRTLDVVQWFAGHGAYGKPVGGGRHAVSCPWMDEHTKVTPATDSDAVVWEATPGRWPSFYCSHNSCVGRGIRDVLEVWGEADRYCSQPFRPVVAAVSGCACGEDAFSDPPEDDWEDPVPISAFDLPSFPVEVLPGWVRDMVEATAESLAVPLDACAMFTQACLATAVQKRVEAVIRPDWREPLSQWVVIVLPPANRKSQLFRRLLVPIVAYEHEQGELMKPEIATAAAEQRILQGRLKKKEEEAYKAKTEFLQDQAEREAIKLATRLENLKVPAKPRLLVNDATPEKLGMLLAENGCRMAVMSPEGDVFEMMAGRYSNGVANLGLYLAGHSGDDHTVDRVSRESIHLTATALTFGLTVQPDILAGFANKPQFRGRGLLGRFLYSMPESLLGTRPALTPAIPTAILDRYDRNLTALLKMPADKGADGEPRPHDLLFDDEAAAEMAAVHEWIEPRMKPWGDLRYLADWAGKLVGQTARSAALLQVATCADTGTPWSIPVGGETVAGARRISEYLIPHAQAAFQSMGMDEAREGARHILGWLKSHPCSRFLRRNLHRRLIRTFEKVESMEEPLAILVEAGYLRTVEAEGASRPGPKGMEFLVHPRFGGQGGPLEG